VEGEKRPKLGFHKKPWANQPYLTKDAQTPKLTASYQDPANISPHTKYRPKETLRCHLDEFAALQSSVGKEYFRGPELNFLLTKVDLNEFTLIVQYDR
jgi:hypothetical protein